MGVAACPFKSFSLSRRTCLVAFAQYKRGRVGPAELDTFDLNNMDYERILCELFPQIDARLIKATLLDGDDLESAVDFLVKEVLRPDGMRSDHVFGVSKVSQEPSANHSVDANASPEPPFHHSDEPAHIHTQTEKNLIEDCQTEGSTEVNCDKQEEAIVWLGGLQNHQLLNSVYSPTSTDRTMSNADLHCENQLYVNRPEEEIISFRLKSSLESKASGHYSDKSHDYEGHGSPVLSEQDTTFIPASISLPVHDFLPFSEERLGFHSSFSQQQQASMQQLQTSEVPAGGLLIDLEEQQSSHDGQCEDCKLTDIVLPVSENANQSNSSAALVEHSEVQEEASAPVHWERSAWEFSLGNANESQGYLEDNHFTGSTTEQFESVNYFDSPKPSFDQSLSADHSCDYRVVQETMNGSFGHSVDTDDLDELVKEAKLDKEHLLKAFEEVQLLRLETEKEEVAAQQAKTAAANGGLDILVKVDEMRQKIAQAKVDNEMRAGEIYGEKAVLSTEAKELSSRLTQAKVEQIKALNLVNEIRSTLSARFDIATREKQSSLEEKVQKERNAQELLAIEESVMDNVSHDSQDLDAEAAACTKLRDFLINRGSIVDSLQGEMSVLCEDVESLKKQVDEGILLSSNRSLSLSRMSHLAEDFLCSSSKSRESGASQDVKTMAFGKIETNVEGSTTALAGSGSSSSKSVKYFVSRTSSCFNSDDTASVHSALGFEYSEGSMTDLPVEEKDTQAVDSALCTDYFSPNNSDMEMTSDGAIPHDLETQKMNSSYPENPGGESGNDQFGIQPDDAKSQTLVKVASNVSDEDLQGWHVEAGDDDWHMLNAQKAKE